MISQSGQRKLDCQPRRRLYGLKKGGMRRLAEAGNTADELTAISGHKTLSECSVTRAPPTRSGWLIAMAKMAEGQNENNNVTNTTAKSYKYGLKSLKTNGRQISDLRGGPDRSGQMMRNKSLRLQTPLPSTSSRKGFLAQIQTSKYESAR
jgi:hypothetical protein